MTYGVVLRPSAEADLGDIWDYTVGAWSEKQAEVYLTGLGQIFDRLAQFPEMARLRMEFTPPVRILPYQSHLIVYLAEGDLIDVIRVLHSRANWTTLLAE
ncbi:toxin ParE1/3/4 [Litoreibacter halocynthiae]|uniref:Toxin n=1 Tax=Litoreibacter halocynthiae TaxID=1242689 RepID=A0A4R7LB41_9RHOB|nr:type II toxin-antitoxin system RelE/ParE family toxin [Litoreibacter halocynthiae]TDT72677.1 toxin ParE1/3/4 [Litoreibacter halocynthiae]